MLPWILVNALGLLAGTAAALLSWRLPRWRLAIAVAALLLLVVKSALAWLPVEEAALFPWPWYIYLQGYWIVLAGLVFLGLAIPQLPVAWNRACLGCLAIGVLCFGAHQTRWMAQLHPLGTDSAPDAEHHLVQSTGYTCAPCACAIALAYVGIHATERSMAHDCLTQEQEGTTPFNTYRGLAIALAGSAWRPRMRRVTPDDLLRAGQIAVIDFPAISHAITVVGCGDALILHDPLREHPRRMSREELAERYGGTAVVIERR